MNQDINMSTGLRLRNRTTSIKGRLRNNMARHNKKYGFKVTKANWKTDPNAYSNEYHKKLRRYLKKQKQKET